MPSGSIQPLTKEMEISMLKTFKWIYQLGYEAGYEEHMRKVERIKHNEERFAKLKAEISKD